MYLSFDITESKKKRGGGRGGERYMGLLPLLFELYSAVTTTVYPVELQSSG